MFYIIIIMDWLMRRSDLIKDQILEFWPSRAAEIALLLDQRARHSKRLAGAQIASVTLTLH